RTGLKPAILSGSNNRTSPLPAPRAAAGRGWGPEPGLGSNRRPANVETADVVIVGAGVVGCSIAYHLAERRAGRVIVLERGQIGTGTTSKGSGGVRLQFSTAINIQLSVQAVPFFEQIADRFGVDPEYQQRAHH